MARFFSSFWFRCGVGAVLFGILLFFGGSRPVLFSREYTLRAIGAFSKTAVGQFLLPRAALNDSREVDREFEALKREFGVLKAEYESIRQVADISRDNASVAATVFYYTNEGGRESLLIDRGRLDGVSQGSFVFDPHLLFVGIVAEAGDHVSKVDVASNSGNAFDARILSTGTAVIARGMGAGVFLLDLVPIDEPVRNGDFVGISPKRNSPLPQSTFFLSEVVGEMKGDTSVFKTVRSVSPVLPAALTSVIVFP